jgi:hypothetical protein
MVDASVILLWGFVGVNEPACSLMRLEFDCRPWHVSEKYCVSGKLQMLF